MTKFTITGSTLQISVGSTNVLYLPTLYIALQSISLYEDEPRVVLFNTAQGSNLTVFEGFLADCVDNTNTPFTLNSFLAFASNYFGTQTVDAKVTGDVSVTNTVAVEIVSPDPVPVDTGLLQGLTDTQLRATPVPISPRPNTTGANGTTPYKLISLASTNANVVKNSGGNLYSIIAIGLTSTVRYLKLYNKATTPTVGTDVPLMTIPVPANTQGAGIAIPFSMGANFPLGIGIAITSGSADNDTGAVGAGDVIVNLTYA